VVDHGVWTRRLERAWLERSLLAWLLLPASAVLGLVVALRGLLSRTGLLTHSHLGVPTIVVGNLVAGGAGKTPTVLAVVELLRRLGLRPGIVSRGYGRAGEDLLHVEPTTSAGQCGDEPLLLRLRSKAPVCVGRDRVAAGRELRRRHPDVNVIVSDDGLQHLRLARDLQVIVFDERGAGNGWLLPAGPLREALPRHLGPNSLVLYNAPAASTALPGWVVQRRLTGCIALADWWQGLPASMPALAALRGRAVVAAAGLARPQRFFEMLQAQGLDVHPLPLPDHFDFHTLPWPGSTADVVVTEKDAVKIGPGRVGTTRVWVAALDFAFDAGFEAAFVSALGPVPNAMPE
jgi:tetraacyldisaccharide 4'-kinase